MENSNKETKFTLIDGHKIVYDVCGQGEIGLLFIHGLCGDRKIWQFNDIEITRNLPLKAISVDYFGHGDSEKDISGLEALGLRSKLVSEVSKAENLKEVILVGHSIAGLLMERIIDEVEVKACCFVDCAKNSDDLIKARQAVATEKLSLPADKLANATVKWLMEYSLAKEPHIIDLIQQPVFKMKAQWPYEFLKATNVNYVAQKTELPVLVMQANFISWDDTDTCFAHHYSNVETSFFESNEHYFFLTEYSRFNKELINWVREFVIN